MKYHLSDTALPLLLFSLGIKDTQAQEDNNVTTAAPSVIDCSALDDCFSCMNTKTDLFDSHCIWATDGRCLSDCSDVTERNVACYYHWAKSNDGPAGTSSYSTTAESLCNSQEQDLETIDLCANITDCSECMKTSVTFTEGLQASNCNWFEDAGYCSAVSSDPDGESYAWHCRDDDSPQAICHFASTDCSTCVATQADENTACTWWGGSCSDWCGNSDEEYCFSSALYPNSTVDEICQASEVFDRDYTLCYEEEEDMSCEVCTSRIKSDGTPCQWLDTLCIPGIGDYTGNETCEAPDSPSAAETNVTDSPHPAAETNGDGGETTADTETNATQKNCSALDDCFSCMNANIDLGFGCFWFTDGKCSSDCPGVTERNVACYYHWGKSNSPSHSYETTAESLCNSQEQDLETIDLCASITDCFECKKTSVTFTDGLQASNCNWFEDAGYCSALSSDPDGESYASYCRDDDSPEAICHFARTDCSTCVATQADENTTCTWFGGACSDWCIYSDEEYCFSSALYPNSTVDEICQASEVFDRDSMLCDEEEEDMSCEVCTSRIKSDGTPCQWFKFSTSWSTPFCIPGIADFTGNETCEAPSNVTDSPSAAETNVTDSPPPAQKSSESGTTRSHFCATVFVSLMIAALTGGVL